MELPPTLRPIDAQVDAGRYCITDRTRRDLMVDMELLRAFGYINMGIIEEWNKSLNLNPKGKK